MTMSESDYTATVDSSPERPSSVSALALLPPRSRTDYHTDEDLESCRLQIGRGWVHLLRIKNPPTPESGYGLELLQEVLPYLFMSLVPGSQKKNRN